MATDKDGGGQHCPDDSFPVPCATCNRSWMNKPKKAMEANGMPLSPYDTLPPKTEGDFHRLTSGEMEVLRSRMICTICSTAGGKCDCWTQCDCGWKYEKGTFCRNPECKSS